jgi:hypothetical protein
MQSLKSKIPLILDNVWLGSPIPDQEHSPQTIYAFAAADGLRPQVFTYTTDADGLEDLANLIRSEQVLAVVKGVPVKTALESVVTLSDGGMVIENRISLKD